MNEVVAEETVEIVTIAALMLAGFIIVNFASSLASQKGKRDIFTVLYWLGLLLTTLGAVIVVRLAADALGRLG